jgi:hypothetical protein
MYDAACVAAQHLNPDSICLSLLLQSRHSSCAELPASRSKALYTRFHILCLAGITTDMLQTMEELLMEVRS